MLIDSEGEDVKKKRAALMLLLLLSMSNTAVLMSGLLMRKVSANPTATMFVDPYSNVYEVGQSFTIGIYLMDPYDPQGYVKGVHSSEFKLRYDSDMLYTDEDLINKGDFLEKGGATFFFETIGSGWIAISYLLSNPPDSVDNMGTLATIQFNVIDRGKSSLDLYETKLNGPYPNFQPIYHDVYDGEFFTTFPRAGFSVLPSRSPGDLEFPPDPTQQRDPVIGDTVTFNATAFVSGGKYKGSYDPDTMTVDDPDGSIVSYQWSFGDGDTTTVYTPVIYHVYNENKTYSVTLTVTDNDPAAKTDQSIKPDVIVQKRDVAITNIQIYPTAQSPGEDVSIKVTIKNLGSIDEFVNVTTYYSYDTTDTLIWYNQTEKKPAFSTVHEIDPEMMTRPMLFKPGKSIIVNYTWTTIGIPEGNYTIWANISMVDQSATKFLKDLYLKELDYNTTNNLLWDGKVMLSTLHNIAVIDIKVSPTLKAPAVILQGTAQVAINVTVRNTGDFDETFYVTLHQNATLLYNWTDISLTKKTSIILNYTWNTATLPIDFYIIKANASVVPGEVEMNRTDDNILELKVAITTYPVASFTYTPTIPPPIAGETVRFNASTSQAALGKIVTFQWTFNGSAQYPVAETTYQEVPFVGGKWNVTLKVTDSFDLTKTISQLIYVRERPIAIFTFTPESPKVDQKITFDASLSNPKLGLISNYKWDFGDGTPPRTATGPTIDYTYTKGGAFKVILTVTDTEDLTGSSEVTVTVTKLTSTISVSANPTTVAVGSTVTISGSITPARNGANVRILYKLGEGKWTPIGNATTDQNGLYRYDWTAPTTIGTYQINSTWTGDERYKGDEDVTTAIVKYSSTVSISVSPSRVNVGEKVTISGSISPIRPLVVVSIFYREGEGEWQLLGYKATDQNAQYTYEWTPTSAGTYQIKVTWDGDDQHMGDEDMTTVTVEEAPSNVFLYIVGGAVAAIVIVAIAGFYFFKHRKTP